MTAGRVGRWRLVESTWPFRSGFLPIRQDRCRLPDGRLSGDMYFMELLVPRALTPRRRAAARKFPVLTVGPRQSGKTTLYRAIFPDRTYASLEAPDVREYARTDPRGFLGDHRAGAILDEIQRVA